MLQIILMLVNGNLFTGVNHLHVFFIPEIKVSYFKPAFKREYDDICVMSGQNQLGFNYIFLPVTLFLSISLVILVLFPCVLFHI